MALLVAAVACECRDSDLPWIPERVILATRSRFRPFFLGIAMWCIPNGKSKGNDLGRTADLQAGFFEF